MATTTTTQKQTDLLNSVNYWIAQNACRRLTYSKVGREVQFLTDNITALLNFEFLLCGRTMECETLDCISCKILNLRP
jgi:hypothetical protein